MEEARRLVDGAMVQACSRLGGQDFGDRKRMRLQPVDRWHDHDKVGFHAEIFLLLYHGRMSLHVHQNIIISLIMR